MINMHHSLQEFKRKVKFCMMLGHSLFQHHILYSSENATGQFHSCCKCNY